MKVPSDDFDLLFVFGVPIVFVIFLWVSYLSTDLSVTVYYTLDKVPHTYTGIFEEREDADEFVKKIREIDSMCQAEGSLHYLHYWSQDTRLFLGKEIHTCSLRVQSLIYGRK